MADMIDYVRRERRPFGAIATPSSTASRDAASGTATPNGATPGDAAVNAAAGSNAAAGLNAAAGIGGNPAEDAVAGASPSSVSGFAVSSGDAAESIALPGDAAGGAAAGSAALPPNEVDALVFAQMIYQRLDGIVPTLDEVESRYASRWSVLRARFGMFDWAHPLRSLRALHDVPFDGTSLMEAAHRLPAKEFDVRTGFAGMGNPHRTAELYASVAASPRFADVRASAYEDRFDPDRALQFAAVTYRLPDGTLVVAYRGTDDSLVGWREDFDMSYQWPVGAQQAAADYLRRVMTLWPKGDVIVTGHSKGGNLAVYAAMMACSGAAAGSTGSVGSTGEGAEAGEGAEGAAAEGEAPRWPAGSDARIRAVYSLDGPGFLPEVIGADAARLDHIRTRVRKIVPEASIVGMIFENEPALAAFDAVRTDGTGIDRHFGFNWHVDVDGDTFEWTELTDEARYWCRSFRDWAEGMTLEERHRALDGIFGVMHAAGYESLTDLLAAMPGALPGLLAAAGKVPPEDRAHSIVAIRGLAKALIGNRAAAIGAGLRPPQPHGESKEEAGGGAPRGGRAEDGHASERSAFPFHMKLPVTLPWMRGPRGARGEAGTDAAGRSVDGADGHAAGSPDGSGPGSNGEVCDSDGSPE